MKIRKKPRKFIQSQAWRTIGGIRKYYRSKMEANYARYLEFLKVKKNIKDWEYEPETFWFEKIKRGVRSYKPDFRIVKNDDNIEYHEVKGFMDNKSKTKLSRMEKYYPDIKIKVIDKTVYAAVKRYSGLINEWE